MRRLGRSTAQISAAIGLAAIAMATPLAWVNAQQAPRPTSGPEANPLDTSKALMAKTKQSLNLKPHAAPLTITPREKIPLDKIKVPAGFKVELWAHGIPGARTLRRGDKGTIFVGSRVIGKVYAVTDKGGERSVKTIVEGQKACPAPPERSPKAKKIGEPAVDVQVVAPLAAMAAMAAPLPHV